MKNENFKRSRIFVCGGLLLLILTLFGGLSVKAQTVG